ncbi:MAG TPA: hypothetical protein GX701_10070, partial [Clostridiales bacterium]|nr:hypothetical protein [Clostridiales bacterium]
MNVAKYPLDSNKIPEALLAYRDIVLTKTKPFLSKLDFCPSVIPVGDIRISVFDANSILWLAGPRGMLYRADLAAKKVECCAELTENLPVQALYAEGEQIWALTEANAFCMEVPAQDKPERTNDGRPARQKVPSYYVKDDARVPNWVRTACHASQNAAQTAESGEFFAFFGTVTAYEEDGQGGFYLGTPQGVMHLSAHPPFDQSRVELYAGARYLYAGDEAVTGVCSDREEGLWIENALGYVHIKRPRYTLRQKAELYDHLADRLHTARGSLCDVYCRCYDAGNDGKYDTLYRYSTNNDAFWSVLHSMGDAYKYHVLKKEGDEAGAEAVRQRIVRVTENVLLQAHVHGFGNGFVCRCYVSVRDAHFVKNGRINTGGLWVRKGQKNEKGETVAVCEDTTSARLGRDDAEGHNMLLTDEVKKRLGVTADRPVTDDFRLALPQPGVIPARLKKLFEQDDPVHPHLFPASKEEDLIFKTDTSSEEVIAAFIQYYFAYRYLVSQSENPEDTELGDLICETAAATLTHLLDSGYCLRDVHGNPTKWGKWFADYFEENTENLPNWRHPEYAFADASLNGAEILCILRVCMYLFENKPAYAGLYERAAKEYEKGFGPIVKGENGAGYAHFLSEYQERLARHAHQYMPGADYSFGINYSDEEMAIMTFWPLLELEQDEERRKIYKDGLSLW